MSMSPLSPTTGSSSSLKSCSDPFRFQPPTVQTSGIGSSTEQQMRFNAFSSPTNQQQIVSSFAAVESRGGKAAPHSSYSNGSSLAASGLSFPMHGGLSNVPTQGYALDPRSSFPCPPPSVQSQVSANPFDSPASVDYVKALSSTAGSGHYGEPTPRQMQYPYSSYYQSPPGQGPGQGPGSAPRQVQGPSPGPSSGQVQGQSLAHTQPALSQHLTPQHQHQNQRNFDQRQYDQSYPAPSYPPTGHLQSQRPPIFTNSGIGSTVLSPGPLRAQVPIDPFSSVDALSWGLGVKKNDPNALSQVATPSSVIYSPTCTREPPKKSNETYYHYSQPSQHSSLSHPVHPPHVVKESTNPFDLY